MATLKTRRRAKSSESGSSLVELAVSLPLLLVLIVGIVDFGFLFQSFEVVTNAAREGARIAVLPGYTNADVQARVSTYVSSAGLPGTATTTLTATSVVPGGGAAFPAAQVAVAYTHQFLFIGPMVSLIIDLIERLSTRAQYGIRVMYDFQRHHGA